MLEYENCFSLNRRVAGIGRWAGCAHPRIFEGAGSDLSSIFSLPFLFARLCAFPPRIPIPQISPFNPLTPCLFNTFPLHSNDTKKVIDTQYTFMLFFVVFANQNLRRFASLTPAALRPPYFRHGVEKLLTRPFSVLSFQTFAYSFIFRIPQLLCLPLLRKQPGCIPTIPILEFNAPRYPRSSPFFLFMHL